MQLQDTRSQRLVSATARTRPCPRVVRAPFSLPTFWVAFVWLALSLPGCARTSNAHTRKVDGLNREALAALQAGNPKQAQKKLQSALSLAKKENLGDHPSVAETHMNLGVVYAAGLDQQSRAVREMTKALELHPESAPNRGVQDGKIDKAFDLAKKRAKPRKSKSEKKAPAAAPAPAEGSAATAPTKSSDAAVTQPLPMAPEPAPVSDLEARLPDPMPEPVFCHVPAKIPPGQDVTLWCGVDKNLRARNATLYARPADQIEFTSVEMKRSDGGWWVGTVPAPLVHGNMLQFYVQAEKSNGEALAANGNVGSPNFVIIRDGARPAPKVLTQQVLEGEDEPPLVEAGPEAAPIEKASSIDWSRLFVALSVGTGWGWHASGPLEFRQDLQVDAGTASAGLGHVLPEVGYRLNERWAFSLQTRHQLLPNEGTTGGRTGRPAQAANAALLRALYSRPLSARFQLQGSASLGAGEGFRMVLDPLPARGRSGTDTVRGGPVLAGAGVGGLFALSPSFGLVGELRTLFGFPDTAAIAELNLGVRYDFR